MEKNKFKALCTMNGKTMKDMAVVIGCSPTSIYDKVKSNRFTLDEAKKLSEALGIENAMEEFFPEFVTAYQSEISHENGTHA